MQFGHYLSAESPKFLNLIEKSGSVKHDGDVRFLTGVRNMVVSRMRNEKYAIWFLLVAESPMNSAMGQIPCSTERISCCSKDQYT